MTSFTLKPHSTPATLLWLQANYEPAEGICIPRNAMYNQYVEFCRSHGMLPVNAASFGKIIRQKFPGLSTRRLGTRGQSRYHYYGLAVKSDAHAYPLGSGGLCGDENKFEKVSVIQGSHSSRCYSTNPTLALPTEEVLIGLPKNVSQSGASTIHIMYTLHCQQLIDYSVHFQYKEVKEYLLHFWGGFPSHLLPLLDNNSIVSLIGVCDLITYRAIRNAVIPSVFMEEIPSRRIEDSVRLAENILDWLIVAMANAPLVLRRLKLHAARVLLHSMRRQASLNHLCGSLRFVLTSNIHLKQMLVDWEHLDMQVVADEILFSIETSKVHYASQLIMSCCTELETLLRERPHLSELGNWMKDLVERCVSKRTEGCHKSPSSSGERLKSFARSFILIWSSVGTRILRELTLLGAHSFGAFHLLYLMLTDYGAQFVESILVDDRIRRLTVNIKLGCPPESSDCGAGTLCDAHCPCKLIYQKEERGAQPLESNDKSLQSIITSLDFMNCDVQAPTADTCMDFCDNNSSIENHQARCSQEYSSDHSSVYYQPSNGLDLSDSASHLIYRPSCLYQESEESNHDVLKCQSPPFKHDETMDGSTHLIQQGAESAGIPEAYVSCSTSYSNLGTQGTCYHMSSSSLSGGHCYEHYFEHEIEVPEQQHLF